MLADGQVAGPRKRLSKASTRAFAEADLGDLSPGTELSRSLAVGARVIVACPPRL